MERINKRRNSRVKKRMGLGRARAGQNNADKTHKHPQAMS